MFLWAFLGSKIRQKGRKRSGYLADFRMKNDEKRAENGGKGDAFSGGKKEKNGDKTGVILT